MREVVLTDEQGTPTGTAEIIAAHTGDGQLHKAFSVFVFRNNGAELLIQQRNPGKMLFGGLWANTCCSHPLPGEELEAAGMRRLQEELGFTCDLTAGDSFVYKAEDGDKGVEYEHDTVLIGSVDDVEISPDPEEIADHKWVDIMELQADIAENPDGYAPWFPLALDLVLQTAS